MSDRRKTKEMEEGGQRYLQVGDTQALSATDKT